MDKVIVEADVKGAIFSVLELEPFLQLRVPEVRIITPVTSPFSFTPGIPNLQELDVVSIFVLLIVYR